MLRHVLDAVLTEDQRKAGLYLDEPDDHELHLKRGEEILASFYSTKVTTASIQEEANKYLIGD